MDSGRRRSEQCCKPSQSTHPETIAKTDSQVTIHMAASLDGFIARKGGSVDWLETSDQFVGGDTMAPEFVEAFLKTIDCTSWDLEHMRPR